MEHKKKRIAVSVTTQEALRLCVEDQLMLFCIEEPLYSQLLGHLNEIPGVSDYDIQEYAEKRFLLLQRNRGRNRFDADQYELYYLPLV